MELLAGWMVCGFIATTWYMILYTFNVRGESDFMEKNYLRFLPNRHRLMTLLLITLALFIVGPIGLADVINTEYKNWRKRKK